MSKKETVKELEQRLLVAKKTVERALDNCKKIELLLAKAKAAEIAEAVLKQVRAAASKAKAEKSKLEADQKAEMVDRVIASYGKEMVDPTQDPGPSIKPPAQDPAEITNEPSKKGSDETSKVLTVWDKVKKIGETPFLELLGKKPVKS